MLCDRKQLTPPGQALLGILGGGQKCHFPHPFLDQTSKIQTWQAELCYHYLDQSANKKFFKSDPFRIRIFLRLSLTSGIETINAFIHSGSSASKTIPDSRPNWAKSVPVLRPKRRKNPTQRGGGAHTYIAYIRAFSPPPLFWWISTNRYHGFSRVGQENILRRFSSTWKNMSASKPFWQYFATGSDPAPCQDYEDYEFVECLSQETQIIDIFTL